LIQDVISARKQEEVIENAIKNWNFVGSLFFAMTVVTTIGKHQTLTSFIFKKCFNIEISVDSGSILFKIAYLLH